MYDPKIARFWSTDPIVADSLDSQGNSYSYVGNRPLVFTDPSGYHPEPWYPFPKDGSGGLSGGGSAKGSLGPAGTWDALFIGSVPSGLSLNGYGNGGIPSTHSEYGIGISRGPAGGYGTHGGRTRGESTGTFSITQYYAAVGGGGDPGCSGPLCETISTAIEPLNQRTANPDPQQMSEVHFGMLSWMNNSPANASLAVTNEILMGAGLGMLFRAARYLIAARRTLRTLPPGTGTGLKALGLRINPLARLDNCGSCAIALDATLGGRPATAIATGQMTMREVAAVYGMRGFATYPSTKAISQALLRAGPGSRGIVYGARADGSAHFFNAVNQGGKVVFLDGQTGAIAATDEFVNVRFLFTVHF